MSKSRPIISSLVLLALSQIPLSIRATEGDNANELSTEQVVMSTSTPTSISASNQQYTTPFSRLSVGGYGEAVFSRRWYSDEYQRYIDPKNYKDRSHGRFDLPHVVIYLGYDFGHGWSMGSEIEFEHGGVEAAVEIENEESGEYETEVERGGEVALEQFWIQKTFFPQLNLRMGMQIVPVGATNAHHEPNQFFGVYRPEGENTLMPCAWHEVGVSLFGTIGKWSYTAMILPGLDSERFGNQTWIHDGSASPYEFKIANNFAGALRIDNRSIPGLRLSVSGYVGNSFRNTLYPNQAENLKDIKGTVTIGSFDFAYNNYGIVARGYFDYGHLSDSRRISRFNIAMTNKSPSKRQEIASDALCTGIEVGYDFFRLSPSLNAKGQKFYLFGRYEYYDAMYKMEQGKRLDWTHRHRIAGGVNWYPIPAIVFKGEYAVGLLDAPFNNEPSLSIGVAYAGFFK